MTHLAYIVIPVFLVLVGGFSLYFQDLLGGGLATMRPVFFWSSVFMLLLIPAVTMRLFSEEHRLGSIENLVTLLSASPPSCWVSFSPHSHWSPSQSR